jgi:hypothetical protein
MTRQAPKHARKKRATKKAVAAHPGFNLNLPPLNIPKIVTIVLWLIGAGITYGTLKSDVSHLKTDVADMKAKIDAIYQHLAFRESGAAGPSIPDVN